jgi:hypothetical protein
MNVSIAIVGRPSVNTARLASTTSRRKRSRIGINSSGSDNTRSNAASSSGSSLTSTGSDSSHKHSARSDQSVSMHTPFSQKPAHLQEILTATPDGKTLSHPLGFSAGSS